MDALMLTHADRALLSLICPHAQLERELERAIVVSSEAVPPDVVTMNSTVVYGDETAAVQRVVKIVYPREADAAAGRVSVLSPVGTALLGLSVGQSIEWDFPDGSRRTLRVDQLLDQPERRLRQTVPIGGSRNAEHWASASAGSVVFALPVAGAFYRGSFGWMEVVLAVIGVANLVTAEEGRVRSRLEEP